MCSCSVSGQAGLEFSEVTHYLLSVMSEVGQSSFLLLPSQNIDGRGEILSAWELMVNFCLFISDLGLSCMLRMRKSDEKGDSEAV